DAFGDQHGVELGLANLGDVDAHVCDRHLHHPRDLATQLLDVLALLADHDAGTRGVNGDVHFARGALDLNAADGSLGELLLQQLAHLEVGVHVRREVLARGIPLRGPLTGDAEAEADRIDFLTHGIYSLLPSPTVTMM